MIPVHTRYIPPVLKGLAGDGMSGAERGYADRLQIQIGHGILAWRFEPIRFKLAERSYYTPDFLVVFPDRIRIVEVKHPRRARPRVWDGARKTWKSAAELYPWFEWVWAQSVYDKRTLQGFKEEVYGT